MTRFLILAIAAFAAGYLVMVWWSQRILGEPDDEPGGGWER